MNSDQQPLFDTPGPPRPRPLVPQDFPFYHGPQAMAEAGIIDASWVPALEPLSGRLRGIAEQLAARSAGGELVLPNPNVMLRALSLPAERVKVLVIGQDPYPTPGHAIGLCFATSRAVRPLPRSLVNIYRELHDDLGIPPALHGDLTSWHEQGVLLLNRVFSVGAGSSGSHQKLGWSEVSQAVVDFLDRRTVPVVAVLWGAQAQKLGERMQRMIKLQSAHPSPLSASRGFFGSRPFSEVNRQLTALGREPVDWQLPA